MKIIDLRSDTVTLPTPAMREAIYYAELGDDVYGEDPTTNHLQEIAAERVGMEAALLVSSGTMGNLVCTLTHCARGEEVLLGDQSHMFLYEAGGMSALGGIFPHTIPNRPDGTMDLVDIESAIRGENIHFPRTRLICVENTHNRCNGSPLLPEYIDSVAILAKRHGVRVHMDGARIFNASVALGVEVREFTKNVDSIIFCLSKGLSAPVGSVICGSREFIAEAIRTRKALGGGMRQAGVIAAAGITAMNEMVGRLAEDHANARDLAEGIAEIPGLSIDIERIKTNILFFDFIADRPTPKEFMERLAERGIKCSHPGPSRFRMVTHYGIDPGDIHRTLECVREVMGAG
jgi:threonine aldolase